MAEQALVRYFVNAYRTLGLFKRISNGVYSTSLQIMLCCSALQCSPKTFGEGYTWHRYTAYDIQVSPVDSCAFEHC